MEKRRKNVFDCPICGNPLIRSKKPQIRCIYCKCLVDVPQNTNRKKMEPNLLDEKIRENKND